MTDSSPQSMVEVLLVEDSPGDVRLTIEALKIRRCSQLARHTLDCCNFLTLRMPNNRFSKYIEELSLAASVTKPKHVKHCWEHGGQIEVLDGDWQRFGVIPRPNFTGRIAPKYVVYDSASWSTRAHSFASIASGANTML